MEGELAGEKEGGKNRAREGAKHTCGPSKSLAESTGDSGMGNAPQTWSHLEAGGLDFCTINHWLWMVRARQR